MRGGWRTICATALLWGATGAKDVYGQELFLAHGIGVPGVVEIGRPESTVNKAKLGELQRRFNLTVRSDRERIIILVVCSTGGCVTERNAAVGMTEEALVRRYGKPVQEQSLKDGKLLRYDGVGFKIVEDAVRAIYIVPRFRALK